MSGLRREGDYWEGTTTSGESTSAQPARYYHTFISSVNISFRNLHFKPSKNIGPHKSHLYSALFIRICNFIYLFSSRNTPQQGYIINLGWIRSHYLLK
jgi:hypothetical protein